MEINEKMKKEEEELMKLWNQAKPEETEDEDTNEIENKTNIANNPKLATAIDYLLSNTSKNREYMKIAKYLLKKKA